MISRRLIVLSIIIASAFLLGAYGIYLKRIEPTAMDAPQRHPLVNSSAGAQQAFQSEKCSSESASEEARQPSAAPVDTYSTRESGDPDRTAGDPAQESEAPIGVLLNRVADQLGVDGHHDLLQFILDEEIKETGLDIEATVSIEAAILEAAVARGMPSDVQSGVSDIQCTASLCTFLLESGGAFQLKRMSPEFQAMMKQGPVSMVWWVRLGTLERQGHVRVCMYRPDIEQHRGLMEAVVAGS